MSDTTLRLALPSNARMEEETRRYFERAGITVRRPSPRQYTGTLRGVEGVSVLFQRASEVVAKTDAGLADIGVTGLNLVQEYRADADALIVLLRDLGFSRCRLVVAVPEAWVDVATVADLADLAADFRARGRTLRVITGSPNLVKDFLYARGITHFTLVEGEGALEVAPAIDTADIVADITETGTTLRDNRLKIIEGGTITESQACLIGNRHALRVSAAKRERVRHILELVEAHERSHRYRTITANVRGASEAEVADHVIRRVETAGRLGPTVAPVYPKNGTRPGGPIVTAIETGWYAVTVVVEEQLLLPAVDHLRRLANGGITVSAPEYVFQPVSEAYTAMLAQLGLDGPDACGHAGGEDGR